MSFFIVKKLYRCPAMLSTSFEKEVAETAAKREARDGNEMVRFNIHYGKRGCDHVNYIEHVSALKKEKEFLFPAYSAFKVREAPTQEQCRKNI